MKTRFLIELSDDERRALAAHYGKPGLATRDTVRGWVESLISATMDEIQSEYDEESK